MKLARVTIFLSCFLLINSMVCVSAGPSDPNTITDPNSVGEPNQTSEPNEPVDSNEPGIDSAYFNWSQSPIEIDPNLEEEPTLNRFSPNYIFLSLYHSDLYCIFWDNIFSYSLFYQYFNCLF